MPEARAQHSVVINKPVAEVFAYMADYTKNPTWQSGIISVRQDGPLRLGQRIQIKRTVMGRETDSTVEVSYFEPNVRFGSKTVSGPADYEGGYRFEAVGEGATRVTYEGTIKVGMFLGPMAKVLIKMFQSQMEEGLGKLKGLLERGA
jgi:carbon monoxide dehydrogenase subunit G